MQREPGHGQVEREQEDRQAARPQAHGRGDRDGGTGGQEQPAGLRAARSRPGARAKPFWTDGRLQCSGDPTGGPPAYLVTPDFTTKDPTPISTRGWVAWYTQAGGWHWLGIGGENAGRWDTWTATATGIAQFHPGGAVTPIAYSWGPISVPPGQGTFAIGVYEIVYWVGGKPDYQWQYVNAGTTGAVAAGGGTLFCAYP